MVERADQHMIGWQEWHYCGCDDPTTSGPGDKQAVVLDPKKAPKANNLDVGKLKILTRPYPQAVAGTPLSYAFDAAKRTFTLKWATRRANGKGSFGRGAVTEVRVPSRQYPFGYVVEATGAKVVSKPQAPVLRLAAKARAATPSVTITPRAARPT
jgi:endoglycosylceramidase